MRILLDHLYQNLCKISASGSFWLLVSLCSGFHLDHLCRTTCRRSLYEDPVGPLVQDLCFRILILLDHLYQDPVVALVQDLCIRILLDRLRQDPVGPLAQDLCIKILLGHCIGILLDHCMRILWDNLCKISVSGSLCEDPLGHLYQDPVGALVQDLCGRIFWTTVSASYRRTCARSLYEGPVGLPLSCKISVSGSLC